MKWCDLREQRWLKGFALWMGVYVVLVVAASIVLGALEPPEWARILLAAVPAIPAALALVTQLRSVRSREGVERTQLTEATSAAFYVTAVAGLTYGFFEAWAGAPRLSGFWVWGFAMGAWLVTSQLMARRWS